MRNLFIDWCINISDSAYAAVSMKSVISWIIEIALGISQGSLLFFKYFSSSRFHNLVHKINEVWVLVGFLILFSEVLDWIVNKVFQILSWVFVIMQELQEFLNILFTVIVTVWLV